MTMTFLKEHRRVRKASSSTLGKNIVQSDKRSEKRTRIIKSDIRLPRPIKTEHHYLPLSLQFPYPPMPSNPNFSPLSSPSSMSSGLPLTPPETSPSSSPRLKAETQLASITPLTISKRNIDLSFGNFFSAPLSPSSSDEEAFDEPISSISMVTYASPISLLISRAQDDPFIIIPPLTPLSEYDEDDERSLSPTSDAESDDDYYTNALDSLLTLSSRMPQQNQHPSTRPESMLPPPRCDISEPPTIPLDEEAAGFDTTRKACFPSAQLDPAWGRRSFLIPTRPPPSPPTAATPESDASRSPSPVKTSRLRPPSLRITKPLPRMSVVPLDTVEEDDSDSTSLLRYYGVSPSYSAFSSSSSSPASLDDFELQFEMDLESDLKFPVSLPGSPSDVEADQDDDDEWTASETGEQLLEQVVEQGPRDHTEAGNEEESVPDLRSRWSSTTLSSIHHLQSPRTPSSSTVSKFKHYLRGSISNKKEGTSHRKVKRGVVVLGSSTSAPFSPGARPVRFANAAMSPHSTTSSFSFGSPTSPTFSDAGMMSFSAVSPVKSPITKPPIPTSPKPTRIRRRPSTCSSSNSSTMSSGSERLRRKPIPVEMFLRV